MSLETENPPSPDDLIQYGREEALSRLEGLAEEEAKRGDCRALNALRRLIEAAGFRKSRAA